MPLGRCLGRMCRKQTDLKCPWPWGWEGECPKQRGKGTLGRGTMWTGTEGCGRAGAWRLVKLPAWVLGSRCMWSRVQSAGDLRLRRQVFWVQRAGDLGFTGVNHQLRSKEKNHCYQKPALNLRKVRKLLSWNDRVALSVAENLSSEFQKCGKPLGPIHSFFKKQKAFSFLWTRIQSLDLPK